MLETKYQPKEHPQAVAITEERLQEMKAYAVKLRKKFPHMKPERIKRKVAEYFKVDLV